ncbi:type IV secretion system protein [Phenylobacterium sp. LjRoot225]|uniref:type IV secretion system protein n=1 Tax=Phenylobacterium sp. LjRoot225 TaxID=3342285 RepID=UPI003ED056DA
MALASAIFGAAVPAQAMVVTDPGAYVRMLQQLNQARAQLVELKSQVAQGKQLYDGFNKLTQINSIASVLNNPALRQYLPAEVRDTTRLLNGSLSDLGSIGTRATSIRSANRLFTPVTTGLSASQQYYQDTLEKSGDLAARDIALGESAFKTAAERQAGLDELRQRLSSATTAKEVMDLQTRIAAEQALINNDQMQLQGLAMMQEAERRMAEQRDREQTAMRNRQTMDDYKAGF